jgi:hypothetical protein
MQLPLPFDLESPEILSLAATIVASKDWNDHYANDSWRGKNNSNYKYVMNMTFLGAGGSRAAFDLHNGNVVKVVREDYSKKQILREWEIWQEANDELKPYLCPIFACADDGAWLVMPKVEMQEEYRYDTKSYADYVKIADIAHANHIGDIHPGNVGYYQGRIVILDYAF